MLSYPGHQVTASCEIPSYLIQGLLEVYFKINNRDDKWRSSGRIFLSYPHTHDRLVKYGGKSKI